MNESAEKDGVKNGSDEPAVTNNQSDDKTNDITAADDNRTQGDNTSLPDQKTQNDSTQDPVNTVLGQPKLSPEERQRKHRGLIEKQKEARRRAEALRAPFDKVARPSDESNGNTDNTNTTPPTNEATSIPTANSSITQTIPQQPREQLIQIGLAFLNNPNVRNMPMSKKTKTLKAKGLTDEEIEIAIGRVEKEVCTEWECGIRGGRSKRKDNGFDRPAIVSLI